MASSHLVHLEETQAVVLKLAAFVDGVNGNGTVVSDAAAKFAGGKDLKGFLHFVLAKSDGYSPECLFAAEKDADVTNIFAILGNILTTEVEASARSEIARLITGHAVNGTDRSVVRLRVLTALFNTLQEPRGRFDVFLALLQFATKTDQVGLITEFLKDLDSHMKKWGVDASQEDVRRVALLSYRALQQAKRGGDAQAMLLKYLQAFNGASVEELNSVKEHASNAVLQELVDPLVNRGERSVHGARHALLQFDAVKNLKGHPEHGALIEALLASSTGDVAALKRPGTISEEQFQIIVENTRLVSLCTVSTDTGVISFADIANAMQIAEEEVEDWIVRAVTANLIEARIDQLQGRVIIDRAEPREFDRTQWAELNKRVQNWRTSIRSLLDIVEKSRQA